MSNHENRNRIEGGENFTLKVMEVAKLLSCSRSLVYKLCDVDRSFPKGIKIGKVRVWLTHEVKAWANSQSKKVR